MKHLLAIITLTAACAAATTDAGAQIMYRDSARAARADTSLLTHADSLIAVFHNEMLLDTAFTRRDTMVTMTPLPNIFFMPAIYSNYKELKPVDITASDYSGVPEFRAIEDMQALQANMDRIQQTFFFRHPDKARYNIAFLPEAPKRYQAEVDPQKNTITIREVVTDKVAETTLAPSEVKRRHWIRTFNASLHFSQAYVSPNWYQGGNNNLNMIGQLYYNVKLNPEFHPNMLFETTAQYKIGVNSAPDDTLRNYNISEDIFQVNSTFGLKAARHWYYSLTAQFKTQLVNSYASNSDNLRSSFLSPGELTAGIGMTYNHANKKKTFTFDASIAPLSYNLKICTNPRMDETAYGIDPGKKTKSHFGSSAECKLMWKISRNITLSSRLFAFTDYNQVQADWENTLAFEINRFLTTQIYAHARYDTQTPRCDDPDWHKLQVKEILSIGFAYKFSSL